MNFAVKPGMIDGNGRLIGQAPGQFNLPVGEFTLYPAIYDFDQTDCTSLKDHRQHQLGLYIVLLQVSQFGRVYTGLANGHMYDLLLGQNSFFQRELGQLKGFNVRPFSLPAFKTTLGQDRNSIAGLIPIGDGTTVNL